MSDMSNVGDLNKAALRSLRAYEEGSNAWYEDDNPYPHGDARRQAWERGHSDRWLWQFEPVPPPMPIAVRLILLVCATAIITILLSTFFNT